MFNFSKADSARNHLFKALSSKKKNYETVAGAAQKYIPLVRLWFCSLILMSKVKESLYGLKTFLYIY